jgi:hypothetical protein
MLQHNPELKSKIDQLWNNFWSGGISNPNCERTAFAIRLRAIREHEIE